MGGAVPAIEDLEHLDAAAAQFEPAWGLLAAVAGVAVDVDVHGATSCHGNGPQIIAVGGEFRDALGDRPRAEDGQARGRHGHLGAFEAGPPRGDYRARGRARGGRGVRAPARGPPGAWPRLPTRQTAAEEGNMPRVSVGKVADLP